MNMKMAIIAAAVLVAGCNGARADSVSCYGGGQLGYSMSNSEVDLQVPGGTLIGLDGVAAGGAEFGLRIGCDVNLGGGLIAGPFADYTWHNDHTASVTLFNTSIDVGGFDTQWTAGGRLGYFVTDSTMVYGLLGYTQVETEGLLSNVIGDFTGTTFGGGVEINLGAGLVGSLEYRYTDFNSERWQIAPAVALDVDPDMHAVRAGVSYKFISF
jgi:outer membrane immunogenic protein